MIVNAKEILQHAKQNKYAIPHFNINNLEWAKFILEECNENNSPVILGVSESAIEYIGGYTVVASMVKSLHDSLKISIPVAIHLDHGSSFLSCKKAIDSGFTSVMIDASRYSLEENIKRTKQVVEYAKKYNVTVEAEIGHIGGSEDNISSSIAYAKVEDSAALYEQTKVDFLAPALGSVHGLYKGEPKIDFVKMKEISERIDIPLVLHGGTGLSNDIIKESIKNGICKVNINTELQIAWAKGLKNYIEENPNIYDPRKIIKAGEKNMKWAIKNKILLLGSNNKTGGKNEMY